MRSNQATAPASFSAISATAPAPAPVTVHARRRLNLRARSSPEGKEDGKGANETGEVADCRGCIT
uniref:Uncharacterized protein n=1 Tax=Oryza rufipogon TaxID=4529 RepID=A0A0E0N6H1_ORYRU